VDCVAVTVHVTPKQELVNVIPVSQKTIAQSPSALARPNATARVSVTQEHVSVFLDGVSQRVLPSLLHVRSSCVWLIVVITDRAQLVRVFVSKVGQEPTVVIQCVHKIAQTTDDVHSPQSIHQDNACANTVGPDPVAPAKLRMLLCSYVPMIVTGMVYVSMVNVSVMSVSWESIVPTKYVPTKQKLDRVATSQGVRTIAMARVCASMESVHAGMDLCRTIALFQLPATNHVHKLAKSTPRAKNASSASDSARASRVIQLSANTILSRISSVSSKWTKSIHGKHNPYKPIPTIYHSNHRLISIVIYALITFQTPTISKKSRCAVQGKNVSQLKTLTSFS